MARNRKSAPQERASVVVEPVRATTESPLVFISHDSRDANLAEAFAILLTDASGGILKSFRSSDRKGTAGIEYGQEWYRAIMQKLDDATDVVALLTTRSVNRPWILYEAGVAKGKLSAKDRVFGIALGISLGEAATGPFAQFQNSPDDEDAITDLVLQLVRRHPQAAPREEAVRRGVRDFRQTVASLLKDRTTEPAQPAAHAEETSVARFFEEIKVLVRDVPERVAGELGNDSRVGSMKQQRRFHPLMIEQLLDDPAYQNNPNLVGIPVLMLISILRDDYPWLYELGIQLYRAIRENDVKAIERARNVLFHTIEVTHRTPFVQNIDCSPESDGAIMLLQYALGRGEVIRLPRRGETPPPKKSDNNE